MSYCLGTPVQLANSHGSQGHQSAFPVCLRVRQSTKYLGRGTVQAQNAAANNADELLMISQSHILLDKNLM